MPRGVRRELNAQEHIPQMPPFAIGDEGPADIETERFTMDDVELEAFMNEPVKIFVYGSNEPNAGKIELVAVEGRNQYIIRDAEQVVKRKYVERLARARRTSYTQDLNPALGEQMNTVQPNTALVYPFAVREDTDKGRAWLAAILQEAM